MTTELREPTYRDAELGKLFKTLRADVRQIPTAKRDLEKLETRLRYVLRVCEQWDSAHVARARFLLSLGNIPAANTHASLIFDAETRQDLLRQCFVGFDLDTNDRTAENAELDREVLA